MELLIAMCVLLNLLGVLCSAFFWEKNKKLRTSPIFCTTFSGFIYAEFNPEIAGLIEILKFVGVSMLVGLGFYFSVWIQCKD